VNGRYVELIQSDAGRRYGCGGVGRYGLSSLQVGSRRVGEVAGAWVGLSLTIGRPWER